MSAVFTVFIALTGFNTVKIGIGAVCTFSQGYTDFGDRYMARIANREEIFALLVMPAA